MAIDARIRELGLRHRRKPNAVAEWLSHYEVADYATIVSEYEGQRGTIRTALPFDT